MAEKGRVIGYDLASGSDYVVYYTITYTRFWSWALHITGILNAWAARNAERTQIVRPYAAGEPSDG